MDIYMDWWEYDKLDPRKYPTDAEHRIIVKKESIPIVFVPGIMGSRLKRGDDRVWDPNDKLFMGWNYALASPAYREKMLGKPGLTVDNRSSLASTVHDDLLKKKMADRHTFTYTQQDEREAKTHGQDADKQGWTGVAWSFYGGILERLADQDWTPYKVFDHPVYAVAYCWVDDNLDSGKYLAGKINDILTQERSKGKTCDRVILVSHSMGGLVCRAAAMLHGAQGHVLGIIHGAQPVLGAPSAYKRMRSGFEDDGTAQSVVLGLSSEKVMPVMTHSVGALELLPNAQYSTDYGESKWLKMTKDGLELESLPSGDPYSSIYEDSTSFLRLVYHPEYISPMTESESSKNSSDTRRKTTALLGLRLEAAKAFHQKLQLMCHPVTYSSWVGRDGPKTWDRVEYRYLQDHNKPHTVQAYGIPLYTRTPADPSEGTGTDYWESRVQQNRRGYYRIQPPDGYGDGTVPESSGSALKAQSKGCGEKLNTQVIGSEEHSAFYNNAEVIKFTVGCIFELTHQQFLYRMPNAEIKKKAGAGK